MAMVMLFLRQTTGKTERYTHFCMSLKPVFTRDCGNGVHFMDEPINGLDPQGIAEVRSTIERLNRERHITFIISSHILGELSKFALNYGIIHNGQLLQELSREELFEKCSRKILLNTPDTPAASTVLEKLGIMNYRVTGKETMEIYEGLQDTAKINAAFVSAGIQINSISVQNQELEDYYLELTK